MPEMGIRRDVGKTGGKTVRNACIYVLQEGEGVEGEEDAEKAMKSMIQKAYFLGNPFYGTNWTEKDVKFLDFLTILY